MINVSFFSIFCSLSYSSLSLSLSLYLYASRSLDFTLSLSLCPFVSFPASIYLSLCLSPSLAFLSRSLSYLLLFLIFQLSDYDTNNQFLPFIFIGAVLPSGTCLGPLSSSHEKDDAEPHYRNYCRQAFQQPPAYLILFLGVPLLLCVLAVGLIPWYYALQFMVRKYCVHDRLL